LNVNNIENVTAGIVNVDCCEAVVPTFWLPKTKKAGVSVKTAGATVTGMPALTLFPESVYVTVIDADPGAMAVIIP
jgi:hypothetical protein